MFEKNKDIMSGTGEWDESEHPRDNDGKFASKGDSKSTDKNERISQNNKNIVNKIGDIKSNSITNKILGNRLKNSEFGISPSYEKHILRGHGDVFDLYRKNIPQIINSPDMIFEGNRPNRVVLIKRIDKQVEVILELSLKKYRRNQIISMWTTTNQDIKRLEKKHKTLYKK